jgi:NADPH2:quinone reductase
MLAIRFNQTGGPEVLEAVDIPQPTPGPPDVLVRNQAVGLNFIEIYQRTGVYPLSLPSGLGSEGAGVVEAVGDEVTRFKVGDRAAFATGPTGAYAEMYVLPEGRAVKLPADIDVRTAAAAMLKGMTSEFLLRRCYPLKAGETVLVWAAAGGVGSILSQWAKAIGAVVIGCVGSPAKAEIARALGCDHTILYKSEDVAARARELTGGAGVRVSYDSVGRSSFEASLKSLGRRGMMVSFGNASGPAPAVEPLVLSRSGSLYLTRPTLFDYVATTEELDACASAVFEVIRSGAVKISIGEEFPLREARRAHEALQSGGTTGSQLLIP